MATSQPLAAVLLHGLHDADDPFVDLLKLEIELAQRGLRSLRFDWPPDFTPRRTVREIVDRDRSFSATLAPLLDSFLRREVAGRFADGEWIVVAHSGWAGNLWYRWLLEYAVAFRVSAASLPAICLLVRRPLPMPAAGDHVAKRAPHPRSRTGHRSSGDRRFSSQAA